MRVLHVSMLYPPHVVGGAERSVALLAEAQQALGVEVAAACTTPGPLTHDVRNGIPVTRMPHETSFWHEDWLDHTLPRRALRKFATQFNRRLEGHFADVLRKVSPDIIHTHSLVDVSTRIWLAGRRRSIPIVHTLRDYDLMCASASLYHHGRPCGLPCKVLTFEKARHHRAVSAVVGVSEYILGRHVDAGYFAHVPPGLRRVIWNPGVPARADRGPPPARPAGRPFTFGYLGRLRPEKGIFDLLDAARGVQAENWRVLIAGDLRRGAAELRQRAGSAPVTFLGVQDPAHFFREIDMLVVPSIWPEPLPRGILEAYGYGVPVLGSDAGGIPELTQDPALTFPAGDVAALGRRMAEILLHRAAPSPHAGGRIDLLLRTSPEIVARKYLDLYRAVLGAAQIAPAADRPPDRHSVPIETEPPAGRSRPAAA